MLNQALRRISASPPARPTALLFPVRFIFHRAQRNPFPFRNNVFLRPQKIASHTARAPQSRSYTIWDKFRDNFNEAKKDVWRKHPFGMPVMLAFAVGSVCCFFYVIYDHITHVEPQYARYPPAVGDRLRKAVYYTQFDLNPVRALQWYKQALIAADQVGMHPFSEEVLAIRMQVGRMLEKAGMMKAAIEVSEKVQKDCIEWVRNGRRKQIIRENERAVSDKRTDDPAAIEAERIELEKEVAEEQRRSSVMKLAAASCVRLAELYSSDHVRETDKAEQALLAAVDLCRTEVQYRRDKNLPVTGDGDYYISLTQVASAFNEMADFYTQRGRTDLSTALYMQSLALIKEDEQDRPTSCAQVVLLNNIASQMAEQAQNPNPPPTATTSGSHLPPISRDQLLYAASEWAKKALDVADKIQPPVRNEECDQGCVTATYNLGEIAEMQGHFNEAKKYYAETIELSKKIQFSDGADMANEALERVKGKV
ncbi:predicted protein [Uncinocarpus reesii 1704]|uniref:TPR domain-containing protein n=1 Tax=Uncinocarpus reesii (strain UAMH 1704) TaxID=336963 RepID=C4JRS7_UNCRE|nr:uncharacterized protein UREG_05166 [Uncinocarpus reesii 1704]EEP80324.1 predicted protein [Uncinocarpus reesii 1704]